MEKITKNMTIEDVVKQYPKTVKVFMDFGIQAIVCGDPLWGTIEEEAERAGVKDIDELLKALNNAAKERFLKL